MDEYQEPVCYCGHALDEHEDSFLSPCCVDDCDCVAYDEEVAD